MALLCALFMVFNESNSIARTLELVLPHVDECCILNSGSTDDTMQVIRKVQLDHPHVMFHMFSEPFVDYSTTRNVLLRHAREVTTAPYFMFLNASDRLHHGGLLRSQLETYHCTHKDSPQPVSFHITVEGNGVVTTAPKVFSRHASIRYERPVFEELVGATVVDGTPWRQCYILHDRLGNIKKTLAQLPVERCILQKMVTQAPFDIRSLYYLAQTCIDMGDLKEAQEHLEQYLQCTQNIVPDEYYYQVLIRWCFVTFKEEERLPLVIGRLHEAYSIDPTRAEALYYLAYVYGYLLPQKNIPLAYLYIKEACTLTMPCTANMYVQLDMYGIMRWDVLRDLSVKMGRYKGAIHATLQALSYKHLDSTKAATLRKHLVEYHQFEQ